MSMNARLTKLEQRSTAAMPICQQVAAVGEITEEGWKAGSMTLSRLAGEDDAVLRERAAEAVSVRCRGDLAAAYRVLMNLMPN